MLDTYRGGYKKALVDLLNLQEHEMFKMCKSKKQYQTMLTSLLEKLLQNPEYLDNFMDDFTVMKVNMKTCEVVEIRRKGGVKMKKVVMAWIEQVIEFDTPIESEAYIVGLKNGRPQKFKVLEEKLVDGGRVQIHIRKQYNNNAFPDD